MLNKIIQIQKTLIDNVEKSFVKISSDFELKKKNLTNEFNGNGLTKLKRLSTKSDCYPHELDELQSSVDEMCIRIRDKVTIHLNHPR
jgi:hypothetical protein